MHQYSSISFRCEIVRSASDNVGAQSGRGVVLRQINRISASASNINPNDLCQL